MAKPDREPLKLTETEIVSISAITAAVLVIGGARFLERSGAASRISKNFEFWRDRGRRREISNKILSQVFPKERLY